jgi:hypothetical protein
MRHPKTMFFPPSIKASTASLHEPPKKKRFPPSAVSVSHFKRTPLLALNSSSKPLQWLEELQTRFHPQGDLPSYVWKENYLNYLKYLSVYGKLVEEGGNLKAEF